MENATDSLPNPYLKSATFGIITFFVLAGEMRSRSTANFSCALPLVQSESASAVAGIVPPPRPERMPGLFQLETDLVAYVGR